MNELDKQRMKYKERREDLPLVSGLTVVLVAISAFILGFALSRTGVFGTWFQGDTQDVLVNRGNAGITDFNHFWEVWDTVKSNYIEENVGNSLLLESAIKGMVQGLDDVGTVYMTAEEYNTYKTDSGGQFEGIGVYLESISGNIVISSVIKGAPAEGVGLVSGDIILEVDGESVFGKRTDEAAMLIKGASGSQVTLKILGVGQSDSRDVTITRASVHADSILLEEKEAGVAYIDIQRFTEDTLSEWTAEWDRIVAEAQSKSPEVIIVDLRFNGGGFLEAGVYAAEEFLPIGAVVTAQELPRVGEKISYTVKREGTFVNTDVIVLVGRYTASAAEIFAGALQKNGRATVIGEQTFGKGTAQSIYEFSDGSALKLTVAHWLMPDGKVLSKDNPIKPDIEVDYNEDHASNGIDDIFNRALEEVKKLKE